MLGSFADPVLAGLGSSIGGLSLGGSPLQVHLIHDRVVVCVNLQLPVGACAADSDLSVQATLIADQTGLTLQDLNAHLGCAIIAGVLFQNITFSFDQPTKQWTAAGTVEAIPGLALQASVTFAHGKFAHAHGAVLPAYLIVGVLSLNQVSFDVWPDRTEGSVDFGSILKVPYTDLDPLAIHGGFALDWQQNPSYFEAFGNVTVFGAPVFDGDVKVFGDGTVTGHVTFNAGIRGLFTVDGKVQADYWGNGQFDVDGDANIHVFDFINVSGEAIASSKGAGVCVNGGKALGHFGVVVHNGVVDVWAPFEGNCDISRARVTKPKGLPSGSALLGLGEAPLATARTLSIPVAAGARGVFFGVRGLDGPPAFALDGPHGEHRVVPATGATIGATGVVFHDVTHAITYVGVVKPSAGTWRVTALPGTTALTELRTGTVRAPVSVKAHVVHKGSAWTLGYSGPRVVGQTVTFLERGDNGVRVLGRATGGGNGSLRFTPSFGSSRPRTVVAIVSQDGTVRTQLSVASYHTPTPKAPGRPTHVVAARHGSTLVVSWPKVAGATRYVTLIRTSDGRARVFSGTKPRAVLGGFTKAESATVSVQALNVVLRSRAAVVKVSGQVLTLSHVKVGPAAVQRSVKQAALTLSTNRAATVAVAVKDTPGLHTVVALRKAAKAGRNGWTVPLTVKGKRLAPGSYVVVVVVTVPGLPPQRRGFVLVLK